MDMDIFLIDLMGYGFVKSIREVNMIVNIIYRWLGRCENVYKGNDLVLNISW
jgi:GTP-binding protein EngB required for normal cell division